MESFQVAGAPRRDAPTTILAGAGLRALKQGDYGQGDNLRRLVTVSPAPRSTSSNLERSVLAISKTSFWPDRTLPEKYGTHRED